MSYQLATEQVMKYYDKNGKEITDGCRVKYPDGKIKKVFLTVNGELGIDATNPVWIANGRAVEGENGIYPFEYGETEELEVVEE